MRATRSCHDCANDGTCGQSIQNYEIGNTDISFFDDSRNLIAKVPKLPKYSGEKYGNRLYREAESKQFYYSPTNIYDVLPSSFTVKHGYINCTVKYDNLSEQEQNQIEADVKTAYEAFKEKFCLENGNASYDITVYIFNNRSDYTKYNDLLNIDEDGGPGYITRGVTNCHDILTYKQDSMDFVLGHELGHIFQLRFSPAQEIKDLDDEDTEFIANIVGREVEEKNHKAMLEQNKITPKPYEVDYASPEHTGSKEEHSKVEESQQDTQQSVSNVIFQALDYIISSISLFFSWLFGSKEKEQPTQQSDGLSLFEFDASRLDHDVGDYLSDNHYYSSDELI